MDDITAEDPRHFKSGKAHVSIQLVTLQGRFSVSRLTGVESLSAPFWFEVEVITGEETTFHGNIGNNLKLQFIQNEQVCRNIVAVLSRVARSQAGSKTTHRLWLTARLFALETTRDTRVHFNVSLKKLCYRLLTDVGYDSIEIAWRVRREPADFSMLVQTDETAYQFFHRLLVEADLFYWFESESWGQRLVIADDNQQSLYIASGPVLAVPGAAPDFVGCSGRQLTRRRVSRVPHLQPCEPDKEGSPDNFIDADNLKRFNQRHQALADGQSYSVRLTTNVAELAPGYSLRLLDKFGARDETPTDQLTSDYLVIGTQHHYSDVTIEDAASPGYHNQTRVIPRSQRCLMLRPRKVKLPLAFSATIESNTRRPCINEQGEQCLRLDGDSANHARTEASAFLRQLTPYACAGQNQATGWRFPLLDGSKVLLSCFNNNPQDAYILGYVQNSEQPPPVTAHNATQNRLVTRGGNELLMDDNQKNPQIVLQSLNSSTRLLLSGNESKPFVELLCQHGILVMKSGQDLNLKAGLNFKEQIGGSKEQTVHRNARLYTSKGKIHYQSAGDIQLQGKESTITSNKDLKLTVGRNLNVQTNKGNINLHAASLHSETKGKHYLQGKHIKINGNNKGTIRLQCNGGGITIDANGKVTISGKLISLKAKKLTWNGKVNYQVGDAATTTAPPATPLEPLAPVAPLTAEATEKKAAQAGKTIDIALSNHFPEKTRQHQRPYDGLTWHITSDTGKRYSGQVKQGRIQATVDYQQDYQLNVETLGWVQRPVPASAPQSMRIHSQKNTVTLDKVNKQAMTLYLPNQEIVILYPALCCPLIVKKSSRWFLLSSPPSHFMTCLKAIRTTFTPMSAVSPFAA